ncbi:sulfate ABC transporter permease subunit CysT [Enterovirga rhinocerotis]|uniref:Sulfate transport system permease protein CysT n=1 Tax=Enterovirga rhinocerotis TaxID=1339210 RepID=A0A4R7C7C9_9HYPH|nr:sulfate ABC transporter permease subunit CysT [Enterovirga rhinocerotis]TDR94540.1 sulfate transport system permease protein [Enterovirga rhinocerotis]
MAAGALSILPGRRRSAIPGFGLAFGYTLTYLGLIVLIPLAALLMKSSEVGLSGFREVLADERVRHALWVSFGTSFAAALTASVFGLLIAWVLVRYEFPGRRIADAVVDLPFALPTAVAGIALAALYGPNGWIGGFFERRIAFTPLGIYLALVFVALPFAVRTVQPLIEEIDREIEEAAATLGSSRIRTILTVILPPLVPGLLTGFVLAFSRAVGEYGSVIFVAGNLPYVSEIAPLLIVIKLDEFDIAGATAIATVMLAISFAALLLINLIQAASRRRFGHV